MNQKSLSAVKWLLYLIIGFAGPVALAQDPASLIEEGKKLEQKLKDEDALAKYKQAAFIQPTNQKAILRCAAVTMAIGSRQANADSRVQKYKEAMQFAQAAYKLDSNNAEANYMLSVAYGKFTEIESKNESLVNYTREIKRFADKAIALDPSFAKAYHVLGRWHLEVVSLSSIKKTALKVVFGGVGEATIGAAIYNMEKCKTLEPYYTINYYDLARAYQFHTKYEKAIATLEQLQKLPTRRQEDAEAKTKGAALLLKLQ